MSARNDPAGWAPAIRLLVAALAAGLLAAGVARLAGVGGFDVVRWGMATGVGLMGAMVFGGRLPAASRTIPGQSQMSGLALVGLASITIAGLLDSTPWSFVPLGIGLAFVLGAPVAMYVAYRRSVQ